MKKIGLIGAMDEEVAIIKEEMTNTNEVTKAGMTFVEGDFYGIKTVAVVSGIGKVNMAVCTQILCDDFHVTMVINTGVAGSLNNALDIGDIVLSSCAHADSIPTALLDRPFFHFQHRAAPQFFIYGIVHAVKLHKYKRKSRIRQTLYKCFVLRQAQTVAV